MSAISNTDSCEDGIPYPIVAVNRGIIVGGVLGAVVRSAADHDVVLALLLRRRCSGERPARSSGSDRCVRESPTRRLKTSASNNNIIAVDAGRGRSPHPRHGLAGLGVSVAWLCRPVALCGFCVGCFLYFQFRISRSHWSGRHAWQVTDDRTHADRV
jgi:hypothetical protein